MNFESKNKRPKACTTCAKAKSRCILGPAGSDKCERCHRLSKPCAPQTSAPPRAKKEPRSTKVAELEKRLNKLTSQLHAVQGQSEMVVGSQSSIPPSDARSKGRKRGYRFDHIFPLAMQDSLGDDVSSPESEEVIPESLESSAVAGASIPTPEEPPLKDIPWPSGPEADALLCRFREDMEPLYPFVITPPGLDAARLALKHPFLFKGVMVSAYHEDAFRQLRLGDRLLQEVTQAAFTQPHKNLDVLQALQLLIAWFHYNINSYQLTNMLFLARSMCLTLGFKDSPFCLGAERAAHNLDHLRAFVGCYYQNTIVFTTSKRLDVFMNTTYVESCCNAITDAAEYPSDRVVVSLFKIMQLTQTICVTLGADNSLYPSVQMPITAVVQSFKQQLGMFNAALTNDLKMNDVIASHVYVAEILLYETAIPNGRNLSVTISPSDRLSLLWGCLNAANGFLMDRFAESVYLPPRFTCLSGSDWLYAVITGVKLHTIEVPGWDINMVRGQFPLGDYVDRQLQDMDRFIMLRRQGRSGDQLVPYPIVDANCRTEPPPPVFDVYEQIRHIISHMKVLGLQEIETLSQLAHARQLRQRQLQESQMSPGQSMAKPEVVEDMAPPTLDASQILRDFDESFWQDAFDDPAWMLGIDTTTMEWMSNY